ncbi:MAG: hypothetical protein FWD48_02245 [Oscillospiraceae bacterium]|nr:hypothetical protein [Oscillospiraceae bacterium]
MDENANTSLDKTEELTQKPDVLDEMLDDLPEERQKQIRKSVMTMMSVTSNNPMTDIAKKIDGEHITAFLKESNENMRLSYKDRFQTKIIGIIVLVFVLLFLVIIVLVFKDSPDIVEKIIYATGGLVFGGLGGFGIAKYKS